MISLLIRGELHPLFNDTSTTAAFHFSQSEISKEGPVQSKRVAELPLELGVKISQEFAFVRHCGYRAVNIPHVYSEHSAQ